MGFSNGGSERSALERHGELTFFIFSFLYIFLLDIRRVIHMIILITNKNNVRKFQ